MSPSDFIDGDKAFLSPTDQKCADSSTHWQFFYYRPSSKFLYTAGEVTVNKIASFLKNYPVCSLFIIQSSAVITYGLIDHDITYHTAITVAESQSDIRITNVTLTGELWGVNCEDLWENRSRYNSTALYLPEPEPGLSECMLTPLVGEQQKQPEPNNP